MNIYTINPKLKIGSQHYVKIFQLKFLPSSLGLLGTKDENKKTYHTLIKNLRHQHINRVYAQPQ